MKVSMACTATVLPVIATVKHPPFARGCDVNCSSAWFAAVGSLYSEAFHGEPLPSGTKTKQPGWCFAWLVLCCCAAPQQISCAALLMCCHCTALVPPMYCHRVVQVWDDAEEFSPERFPLDQPVPTEQNTDYR